MRALQKGPGGMGSGQAVVWANYPNMPGRSGGGLNGRPLGQEYDGLESGELAWILGRRFISSYATGPDAGSNLAMAGGGGFGPDRMQRLAYTAWIEAFFHATFGKVVINLAQLPIASQQTKMLSSEIETYSPYLTGASVLGAPDVPHVVNDLFVGSTPGTRTGKELKYATAFDDGAGMPGAGVANVGVRGPAEQDGLACGLFVMESGPFLRGKVVEDMAVDMIDPTLKTANLGRDIYHTVARNLGDTLAFEGLYAHMKTKSFFDWSPDGMVLSKLESPSGDPLSSAELDARQAQLFNIAVQGPAIAKTWTGDPKMQCMPMDRVFVVMVADVVSTLSASPEAGIGAVNENETARVAYQKYKQDPTAANKTAYDTAAGTAEGIATGGGTASTEGAGAYAAALDAVFAATLLASNEPKARTGAPGDAAYNAHPKTALETAEEAMLAFWSPGGDKGVDMASWETRADTLRRGASGVESSVMTNFRMMRVTSSYLAQYSGSKKTEGVGRCGLRLGVANKDGTRSADGKVAADSTVAAEYIIGGWCIGTVVDSAASRSTVGHQVRMAPASMAININVNVEWWSGDKLYKHYMDVSNSVQRRGEVSKDEAAFGKRAVFSDVGLADLVESVPWLTV